MYASRRTIGKQGVWDKAPVDDEKNKVINHNNKGNARGRKYYVQVIEKKGPASDANEKMSKTVVHLTSGDTFAIRKKKKKQPGYKKSSRNRRAS